MQATNADIVLISSYPSDSVGIIRSANELGLKTKMFGGNMTGPQSTSIKTSLGPMLNGIITFDWWLPSPKMRSPGSMEFLEEISGAGRPARASIRSAIISGPGPMRGCRCWARRSKGPRASTRRRLPTTSATTPFKTVVGDVKFGKKGEWDKARILTVQFQNISGTSVDDFRDGKGEVVIGPEEYKAGDAILPYTEAKGK